MQVPTLRGVHVRTTRDALQIFYAVAQNVLPKTLRRLDVEERKNIAPGDVFVWEERGATLDASGVGIERWTDGRSWSPSKVREEFLMYIQKPSEPEDVPKVRHTRSARQRKTASMTTGDSGGDANSEGTANTRPSNANETEKLIKQTYSVLVNLPNDEFDITRKWHLTAYVSQESVDSLRTIDMITGVGNTVVPEGLFRSAKTSKTRRSTETVRTANIAGPSMEPHFYPTYPSPSLPPLMTAALPTLGLSGPCSSRYEFRSAPYSRVVDAELSSVSDGGVASDSTSLPSPTLSDHEPFVALSTHPSSTSTRAGNLSRTRCRTLAPLESLRAAGCVRRDPGDEELLRRFLMFDVLTAPNSGAAGDWGTGKHTMIRRATSQ